MIEKWLIKNQRFINITGYEKELKLPKGLIQKYIKYGKKINEKHIDLIFNQIKKVCKFNLRD